MNTKQEPSSNKGRGWILFAIALTGIWVIFCFIWLNQETVFGLNRNEFGDFVGGVVGPVALIWIVVGVWQQGEDLRHQRMELARHVEATNKLVGVDRELLEHEREIRQQEQAAIEEEERKVVPKLHWVYQEEAQYPGRAGVNALIDFENLGGSFVIKQMHSAIQGMLAAIDHHDYIAFNDFTINRGDIVRFKIGPIKHMEDFRILMTVTYGRDHIGTMEVKGKYGEKIDVSLHEKTKQAAGCGWEDI